MEEQKKGNRSMPSLVVTDHQADLAPASALLCDRAWNALETD